jgi:hypothetical protein
MNPPRASALFLVAALLVGSVVAQAPSFPEADVKKLAELVSAMYAKPAKPDPEGRKEARAGGRPTSRAKSSASRRRSGAHILKCDASVGRGVRRGAQLAKAPSGLGRATEFSVKRQLKDGVIEFKSGILLPNGYDPKKRYPLIVSLHDEGAEGREMTGLRYIEEVWMKLPKEKRDAVIILAPTHGPKAGGKDFRIEKGDQNSLLNVLLPWSDVVTKYSIDLDRMYLDGCGSGGELAALLAAFRPYNWAGVALREALPRNVQYCPNWSSLPVAVHHREGGPVERRKDNVDAMKVHKDAGVPIEFVPYPALDAARAKQARGSQENDPIAESTGAIADWFLSKSRAAAPETVNYFTNRRGQRRSYWVELIDYEIDPTMSSVKAKVDRAANSIEITCENVNEMKVTLSDRMLDLDKPVKVVVNGKPIVDKTVERSMEYFLKYYEGNAFDPGVVPSAEIMIKVPTAEEPKSGSTLDGG